MYSMLSLAMPEETSFCFQISISNLFDLCEKLHKQILLYCIEGEYAGTKQQLSILLLLPSRRKCGNMVWYE